MHTVMAILLFVTAVVTLAYWADFFLHGSVNVVETEWYVRFQRAFPAADVFMSVCAVIAGVGLLADAGYGVALALVAGGALIFLGLLDVTFNVENGLYACLRSSWPMRAELVINLWSLGLGAALLVTMLPEV